MRLQPIVDLPLAASLAPADQLLVVKNGVVCLGTVGQLTGLSAVDLTVNTLTVNSQATVNGPIFLNNPTGVGAATSLYRTSTTFNGTVDQGTFIGYNTNLFGQIPDAALGSVMIGFEDNYNDGSAIYTEFHVNIAKPAGSYVRPFAAYMNRSTGVLSTALIASAQIDLFASTLVSVSATELRLTNGDAVGTHVDLSTTSAGGKRWGFYSTGPSATGGAGNIAIFNSTNTRMGLHLYGQASAGISLSVTSGAVTINDASSLLQLGEGGEGATTRTNIRWRNGGAAVPSTENNLSNGDKAVFWNSSSFKSAIGIEGSGMWSQISGSSATGGFKWYAGASGSPALEFTIATNHSAIVNYWVLHGRSTTNNPIFGVNGSDTNIATGFVSKGTGRHAFYTAGTWNSDNIVTGGNEQFRVSDTASAVNFVGVTGNSTGGQVAVFADGTDTDVGLKIITKAAGSISLLTNIAAPVEQARVTHTASANRYLTLTGSNGGNPALSVSAGALALGAAATDIQWLRTNIALGGGAAPTVGTIGGSGPAAAAQRNWLRFIESDGTASFIPVWR